MPIENANTAESAAASKMAVFFTRRASASLVLFSCRKTGWRSLTPADMASCTVAETEIAAPTTGAGRMTMVFGSRPSASASSASWAALERVRSSNGVGWNWARSISRSSSWLRTARTASLAMPEMDNDRSCNWQSEDARLPQLSLRKNSASGCRMPDGPPGLSLVPTLGGPAGDCQAVAGAT